MRLSLQKTATDTRRKRSVTDYYEGSGTPEGSQVATVPALYVDTSSGQLYQKISGSGNTGWVAVFQTITLTGHVTGSGTDSFATTIASGVITNTMIAAAAAIDGSKIAPAFTSDVTIIKGTAFLGLTSTAAAAKATIDLNTLATTGGDAAIRFNPRATTVWSVGSEVANSNQFVIANGAVLSSNQYFKVTTAGVVSVPTGPLQIANGTQSAPALAFIAEAGLGFSRGSGGSMELSSADATKTRLVISSITSNASSYIYMNANGSGDIFTTYSLNNNDASGWTCGLDQSDTAAYKIDQNGSGLGIGTTMLKISLVGAFQIGATSGTQAHSTQGTMQFTRPISVAAAPTTVAMNYVGGNTLSATNQLAFYALFEGQTTATAAIKGFVSDLSSIASASLNCTKMAAYDGGITVGAGGTVTRGTVFDSSRGIVANGTLTNSAHFSDSNSYTGNYFLFAASLNPSVLGGRFTIAGADNTSAIVTIGNQSATAISSSILNTAQQTGLAIDYTITSAATTNAKGIDSFIRSANASFTTPLVSNFFADGFSKGASHVVTRYAQYLATPTLAPGTNNAVLTDDSSSPSWTGNAFIHQKSTYGSTFNGPCVFVNGRNDTAAPTGTVTLIRVTNAGNGAPFTQSQVAAIYVDPAFSSTTTADAWTFYAQPQTASASFTLARAYGYYFAGLNVGSGSTVSKCAAYGGVMPSGAGNNVFLTDSLSSVGTSYFIYGASTSPSFFGGQISSRVGLSSATRGILVTGTNATNQIQNSGSGETSIQTYSVLASTLGADQDCFEYEVHGTFANNANNKRVRIQWDTGGTPVTAIDTTSLAFQNTSWTIRLKVFRTGATTQKLVGQFFSGDTLLRSKVTYSTGSATLSGAVQIDTFGTGTTTGDVSREAATARFIPGA